MNPKTSSMSQFTRWGRLLFAIPWIIFGIQHYMYAGFVTTLVPAYMPFRAFWVYFTGTAMIAAGISFILCRQVRLAASLLGGMLLLFVLQLHTVTLTGNPHNPVFWTRALQDIALAGAAFALASEGCLAAPGRSSYILAGKVDMPTAARYLYALPLIFLGGQHFWQEPFVTGKIPDWLPLKPFWDYLIGSLIILAAISILLNRRAAWAATRLGAVLLLLFGLLHIPLLITDPHNGLDWTGSMLDLAIAAGALILAPLLRPQVSDGIGDGSFQRLEADGGQGNQYRKDPAG